MSIPACPTQRQGLHRTPFKVHHGCVNPEGMGETSIAARESPGKNR